MALVDSANWGNIPSDFKSKHTIYEHVFRSKRRLFIKNNLNSYAIYGLAKYKKITNSG